MLFRDNVPPTYPELVEGRRDLSPATEKTSVLMNSCSISLFISYDLHELSCGYRRRYSSSNLSQDILYLFYPTG